MTHSHSTAAFTSRPLPHERLDAFHVAVELVELVAGLRLPRGYADLRDQSGRAASSVALNLAEGAGKSGRDGARYFQIARGSVCEVAAALRILLALRAIGPEEHAKGRTLCERVYAMCTRLISRAR